MTEKRTDTAASRLAKEQPSGTAKSGDPGELPDLALPPNAPQMSLGEALFGVIPYWGVKRTIDAYRRAVNAGASATQAVTALYAAMSDLEVEKERWENVDLLRERARLDIEADLMRAKSAHTRALMEHEAVETEAALADLRQELVRVGLEAKLAQAQREKLKAEEMLDELDAPSSRMERKLREATRLREQFKEFVAYRDNAIQEAGGLDKLSDNERLILDELEEHHLWQIKQKLGEGRE